MIKKNYLEPIDYLITKNNLSLIKLSISSTMDELKEKRPDFNTKRMEEAIEQLNEAIAYIIILYENGEMDSRRCTDITLANLKLAAENDRLNKEVRSLLTLVDGLH
jgi:hypothetical protein